MYCYSYQKNAEKLKTNSFEKLPTIEVLLRLHEDYGKTIYQGAKLANHTVGFKTFEKQITNLVNLLTVF